MVKEKDKAKLRERIQQLELERNQTMAEMERIKASLRYEVEQDTEEGDPDIYEREKSLALLQNLEHKLESIEYALRLAEEGVYGICERCGQPIDPARLKALPHATHCIKCQTELERQARPTLRTPLTEL
ncbi:MAG: TraR/DksA C4-type zinc finger protein [Chloroflexi bacterium]|nr:TraR/DksA C4-type zinc finger protein [Chloroflexota bacterium]